MISVKAIYKDNLINQVTIKGHAGSDDVGKDLVCAAVSAICTGVCNELDHRGFLDGYGQITLKNGFSAINVNRNREDFEIVLETLITSLKTVEEVSGNYIQIMEEK